MTQPNPVYLPGLNSIRFFAAFYVLIGHGNEAITECGITVANNYAFFNRATAAVELFFTLSGFLITYLLLREIGSTSTVDVKYFYLRRILRIWPLYFASLFLGLVILGIVYPKTMGVPYLDASVGKIVILYVLFLPNLAASFYKVGVIGPLWSIGIEEQFYLCWAPLVKIAKNFVLPLVVILVVVTSLWYVVLNLYFGKHLDPRIFKFLGTMRFHNMAIGALFAYVLHFKKEAYAKSLLAGYAGQAILLALVGYYFLIGRFGIPKALLSVIFSFVYGCIFINVSSLERPLVNLEIRPFVYLGEISYGLYMYHSFVEYVLRYASVAPYSLAKSR